VSVCVWQCSCVCVRLTNCVGILFLTNHHVCVYVCVQLLRRVSLHIAVVRKDGETE